MSERPRPIRAPHLRPLTPGSSPSGPERTSTAPILSAVSVIPGVAALVPSTKGFRLQSHYLNTSGQDLTANVAVTLHLAESGTITAHAGVLFVIEPLIYVDPGQTKTITHDCQLPHDMNIIIASSHMHKHATNFIATIAGVA